VGAGRMLEVVQSTPGSFRIGDEVVLKIDSARCYFIAGGSEDSGHAT